jgi:hypothetical protein
MIALAATCCNTVLMLPAALCHCAVVSPHEEISISKAHLFCSKSLEACAVAPPLLAHLMMGRADELYLRQIETGNRSAADGNWQNITLQDKYSGQVVIAHLFSSISHWPVALLQAHILHNSGCGGQVSVQFLGSWQTPPLQV